MLAERVEREYRTWQCLEEIEDVVATAYGLGESVSARIREEMGFFPTEHHSDPGSMSVATEELVELAKRLPGRSVCGGTLSCTYQSTGILERLSSLSGAHINTLFHSDSVKRALIGAQAKGLCEELLSAMAGSLFGRHRLQLRRTEGVAPDMPDPFLPVQVNADPVGSVGTAAAFYRLFHRRPEADELSQSSKAEGWPAPEAWAGQRASWGAMGLSRA